MIAGRNQPCPCGSGKKHKRCCGALRVAVEETEASRPSTSGNPRGPQEALLADILGCCLQQEGLLEDLRCLGKAGKLESSEAKDLARQFEQGDVEREKQLHQWEDEYGELPDAADDCVTDDSEVYRGFEPEAYYDCIEAQHAEMHAQGMFEVLRIMQLDEEHSDRNMVEAVRHFNALQGSNADEQAPVGFLNKYERRMLKAKGKFRPKLYAQLLSLKFSDALKAGTIFIKDSLRYSYEGE